VPDWLNTHLPHAERISQRRRGCIAGCERKTARQSRHAGGGGFNIAVQAANIEDDPRNTTRLVIGNQDVAASGHDKTSLVMSAVNRPGAVHDLLVPLAKHGVSMNKLESRPARAGLWEYVFFVDIEGHQQDTRVAEALKELKDVAAFVKVLGSYPVANI
jgi:chorismate mutase/prephenate dehydratase